MDSGCADQVEVEENLAKIHKNVETYLRSLSHLRPSPIQEKLDDVEDQRNLSSARKATAVAPHSVTSVAHRKVQKCPNGTEYPIWWAPCRPIDLIVPRIHVRLGADPEQSRSNDRNRREYHYLNDFVVEEAHFRRSTG